MLSSKLVSSFTNSSLIVVIAILALDNRLPYELYNLRLRSARFRYSHRIKSDWLEKLHLDRRIESKYFTKRNYYTLSCIQVPSRIRDPGNKSRFSLWPSRLVLAGRVSTTDGIDLISAIYRPFPPTRNNLSHLRAGPRGNNSDTPRQYVSHEASRAPRASCLSLLLPLARRFVAPLYSSFRSPPLYNAAVARDRVCNGRVSSTPTPGVSRRS